MNMNEITIMIIYLIDMINVALSRLLGRLGLLRVMKMKTLFFCILSCQYPLSLQGVTNLLVHSIFFVLCPYALVMYVFFF